jgi:hypothetical protein|tara:strand:+ start:735 stop:959 length:225 start_codon:yes stop_codon:yes gene_type:complete
MARKGILEKDITIAKNKFRLEIYLALEGKRDLCWEIFPLSESASLYALENKKKLNKIIEKKYIYEQRPTANSNI